MKVSQAIKQATNALSHSQTAILDAELLLTKTLGCRRSYLYSHPEQNLSTDQSHQFQLLLQQRRQGRPIAYLTGQQEFWSLPLMINDSVLIPRPETELLVEAALSLYSTNQVIDILELGTGSGAISLALGHERPHWQITATDYSATALKQANQNAGQLAIKNITFIKSDWFQQLPNQVFDIIVTNPPYLAKNDPHLSVGDLRFEPLSALTGGEHGLEAIDHIIKHAHQFLKPQGYLLLEHGYQQADSIRQQLSKQRFSNIINIKDLSNLPRVSLGQYQ